MPEKSEGTFEEYCDLVRSRNTWFSVGLTYVMHWRTVYFDLLTLRATLLLQPWVWLVAPGTRQLLNAVILHMETLQQESVERLAEIGEPLRDDLMRTQ